MYKIATVNTRMKAFRALLMLLFIVASIFPAGAQSGREISGKVLNTAGQPLTGVTVEVKGTTLGTSTDAEGTYKLRVGEKAVTLVFSYVGYAEQEKTAAPGTTSISVTLSEKAVELDQVVVVGYGTLKKKDVTGSVSHIGKEVMENKVATNAVDFLKGNIAGVNIGINNNASGGGSIQVRGPASLRAGTSPLIVVDGNIFYGNIADINPNDIESIDVLKDASSTAIYGSKGSAGVVAITTKRGRTTKPTITLSSKLGVGSVMMLPEAATPEQYLQRRMDYWKTMDYFAASSAQRPRGYFDNPYNLPEGVTLEQWTAGATGDPTEIWLERLQLSTTEIENFKAGRTTDWLDLVYRDGLRQDYNASFAGRSDKVNYFTSVGTTHNEGYKVGDEFRTVRARLKLDADVNRWFRVGANAMFADRTNNRISPDVGLAYVMSPYGSAFEADGSIKRLPTDDANNWNPLLGYTVQQNFNKVQTMTTALYGRIQLPYGLSLQTTFNNRWGWSKDYRYSPDIMRNVVAGGEASRREYSDYEWLIDHVLKWNYTLRRIHNFDVTAVASTEKYQNWSTTAINSSFVPSGVLGFHNINAGITPEVGSDDQAQTGSALLGRVNYSLKNRYILTASIRRDGFSAFGVNNPYGTYPAFAAAWRLSEERFLKDLRYLDNLKLRLSWGETGNRDIGRYAALSTLRTTDNFINGADTKGLVTERLANNTLKWERTQATNIGVDFGVLDNRISGVVDVYYNTTNDLILNRALPTLTGFSSVIANLGEVSNQGLEVTLNTVNIDRPDRFRWASTFIYSRNRNEIRHLYGNMVDVLDAQGNKIGTREADDPTNGWYIGHGIYDIYDYKVVGIWQLGDELEAKRVAGKQPGDPRLLDANGDGKITSDEKDRVWIGSAVPLYRMSLRNDFQLFNNLTFSFTLRGDFNYWDNDPMYRNEANRFFDRNNSYWSEYWTPWKPSETHARLASNIATPTANFYRKRDYVRLQNAALSYTVPAELLKRYSVEGLRASLAVDNAFVVTGWNYYDPETSGTSPRIYTFGVDVTL